MFAPVLFQMNNAMEVFSNGLNMYIYLMINSITCLFLFQRGKSIKIFRYQDMSFPSLFQTVVPFFQTLSSLPLEEVL